MNVNANLERTHTKRRLCQFTRTASVTDPWTTEYDRKLAKRKRDAERYEQRHGTAGKRSVFAAEERSSGTARQSHAANRRAWL